MRRAMAALAKRSPAAVLGTRVRFIYAAVVHLKIIKAAFHTRSCSQCFKSHFGLFFGSALQSSDVEFNEVFETECGLLLQASLF
jgi:hypothetical protein